MGNKTEKKKPRINVQKVKQTVKSDNFWYRKVGRAITKWKAKEKSPILLSQYQKNIQIDSIPKIISHFGGHQ